MEDTTKAEAAVVTVRRDSFFSKRFNCLIFGKYPLVLTKCDAFAFQEVITIVTATTIVTIRDVVIRALTGVIIMATVAEATTMAMINMMLPHQAEVVEVDIIRAVVITIAHEIIIAMSAEDRMTTVELEAATSITGETVMVEVSTEAETVETAAIAEIVVNVVIAEIAEIAEIVEIAEIAAIAVIAVIVTEALLETTSG